MKPFARYKLVYNRQHKLDKNGRALVQLEIYLAGRRAYVSTGIYLKPEQWDGKNKRIIKKNSASWLMNEIRKMIRRCEDMEAERRYTGQAVTLSDLVAAARQEEPPGDDFITFMDQEITRADISYASKLHQLTTLKALREFGKLRTWKDLTYDNIEAFTGWLHERGLAVNTIANYHKHIKSYIKKAIRKEIFDAGRDPYIKYKIKRVKTGRSSLTMDELGRLEDLELSGMDDALEYVRDLFLFSCYTGLRYSDLMALEKKNILDGREGITVRIMPAKTGEMSGAVVTLPLRILFDGKPEKIMKKYMSRERIFPQISNQHLNRYLKILAMTAGINRRVTFHMARHTFGTILADKTGDPFLIKSLMGHSKIETSMLYIHESQAGNEAKIRKINW